MKTKQLLLTILLVALTFNFSKAQEFYMPSGKVGLSFSSLGKASIVSFKNLDGAASYESEGFYSIGINYVRPIASRLEFEIGVEYSHHDVLINPPFTPGQFTPGQENNSHNDSFAVINVPITLRKQFWKYLFFNGGLILGFDAGSSSPISSQTGIGAIIGFGAQYQTNSPIGLFINPYFKAQNLIPFSMGGHHLRVIESGVRVGATYVLN